MKVATKCAGEATLSSVCFVCLRVTVENMAEHREGHFKGFGTTDNNY